MNDAQIRQIVREEIQRHGAASRFGLKEIPYHVHDGIDSPQISQNSVIPSLRASGSVTFTQATQYTLKFNANFSPSFILAYGIVVDSARYTFTVTAANATASAVYSNSGFNFTVTATISGGVTLVTNGVYNKEPASSGTLTKVSGTGDATITYSAVVNGISRRCHTVGSASLGPSFYFQPESTTTVITGGPQQEIIQSSSYISATNGGTFFALTDEQHIVDIEDTSIHARATVLSFGKTGIVINVDNLDSGWNIIVNYVIS